MKAYILSDDKAHGIKLANIINAAKCPAILSESEPASYEEMIDEAEERVNSGYSFGVVVSRNPLEASIHANKNSKLRAVVCRTPADAARARAARANLIVLDSSDFTKTSASSIMHAWLGSTPEVVEEERRSTAPGRSINISGIGKGVMSAFMGDEEAEEKEVTERPQRPKAKRAVEDEEEAAAPGRSGGGGVKRSLLNMFMGSEEEEEKPERQERPQKVKPKPKPVRVEEEEDREEKPRGKGLMKRLKYELGLE